MNPDDFDRLFDGAFTEWARDPAQSPLAVGFPVSVIERLRSSSVDASRLLFGELKRLEGDPKAEREFRSE